MNNKYDDQAIFVRKYIFIYVVIMIILVLSYTFISVNLLMEIEGGMLFKKILIMPMFLILILVGTLIDKIWPKREISLYQNGQKITREEAMKMVETGFWGRTDEESAKKRLAVIIPIMVVLLVGLWKLAEYLLRMYLLQ